MKMRPPLPLLAFLCFPCGPAAVTKFTPLDMTFYSGAVGWAEAQRRCRTAHADLVSIRDRQDAADYLMVDGWIGLYRTDKHSPWKWSREDEDADFFQMDTSESVHACAAKRRKHPEWYDHPCKKPLPFTCVDERLVLVKENKTWEEALVHCRSLRTASAEVRDPRSRARLYDLASLVTDDDHAYARGIARDATTPEVWTGLRFLAGRWWWSDGEAMPYEDAPGCPGVRACGVLEKSGAGRYGTRDCRERRNFLCYKSL